MLLYKIKNYFKPKTLPFTWNYFDIDNELVNEIKDIYLKNLRTNPQDYEFFQLLKIKIPNIKSQKIVGAGLVVSKGNTIQKYCHKDPIDPNTSPYALNIPLKNCEKSETNLYNVRKRKSILYTLYGKSGKDGNLTEIAKISDCDIIATYTLDRPLIFNTQILHSVNNFSSETRVAISLRFDKSVTPDTFN